MVNEIRVVVSSLDPGRGAIKLRVAQPPPPEPGVKIKVEPKDVPIKLQIKEPIKVYLKIRSTLEGNYIIYDHPLYDIIIMPSKNKILTFLRADAKVDPYPSQNKLFNFLRYRGIIAPDTIQGGNVYGSLEGVILESPKLNVVRVTLKNISEWMEVERPYQEGMEAYEEMMDDYLTEPDADDSTPLGKVPQAAKKGSIMYKGLHSPYFYGQYLYENTKNKLGEK